MRNIVTYNSSWLTYNGVVAIPQGTNPLNLPAYTMRFQFGTASYDPSAQTGWPSGATWTRVSTSPNVWDFTYQNSNWTYAFAKRSGFFDTYVGQFLTSSSGATVVIGANTTDVTNLSRTFYGCDGLTSLSYFDTSNVTDMSSMLYHCSNLSSMIAYDTENVTTMSGMFNGCSKLTAVPLFDTSNVTDMSQMFSDCSLIYDIPAFNTSNVTNMANMFRNCTSLVVYSWVPAQRHPLPRFDTSRVTNMSQMFYGCESLSEVPAYDTTNVRNMSNMFAYCLRLPRVPTFNTSRVTNMQNMFYHCGNDLSSLSVWSQYPDFVLPLLDTSSVTNMSGICFECTKLQSIPLLDTSSVESMYMAFDGCTAVQSGALALYQQASTQANVPSSHANTFRNCGSSTTTGAAELAQIPTSWGGTMQ